MRARRSAALVALGALLCGCGRAPGPNAVRAAALVAIAERGSAAAAEAPRVVEDLAVPELADLAIWALGELGPDAAPVSVPALLALQVADNPLRHAAVCIALGRAGERGDAARDYLAAASASPFVVVRQAARGAASGR